LFDTLIKGFREAQNRLSGLTELTAANIQPALQEVRTSLLDADVELGVVKRLLARIEEKAVGQTVQTRVKHQGVVHKVTASEQFVKICNDELIEMMRFDGEPIQLSSTGKTSIMMVGLQGSGKTTTAAKLARWFQKDGKKPLLVAADLQRPAAVEQLKVLGEQIGIPVFSLQGQTPVGVCRAAPGEAKKLGCDVIIYDTAGRLAVDEPLMQELGEIKAAVLPENILLVVDAMIGQDAVKTARSFNERLKISGVVLTKLDGDARGGAALSIKEVTGAPVVFVGMGETTDKLDLFRPEGMASRVLGMGDVVGLIQDFEQVVDQKKAEQDAMRLMSGEFTLQDFLNQVRMIQQMGSLKDLMEKIPGLGGMVPPGMAMDDKELVRIEAMIQSMTSSERDDPNLLIREPGRVKRVARGSGSKEQAVSELIQKFLFLKQMMSGFGQNMGMLGKIPGMKGLAAARHLRRAAKGAGGAPGMGMPGMGMPGMGMPGMGMPGMGMPGMGMPGMGMPGMGGFGGTDEASRMKPLSKTERNARKNSRKRERDARKKTKKK
jgi:signal recognition particle subunit SRP54